MRACGERSECSERARQRTLMLGLSSGSCSSTSVSSSWPARTAMSSLRAYDSESDCNPLISAASLSSSVRDERTPVSRFAAFVGFFAPWSRKVFAPDIRHSLLRFGACCVVCCCCAACCRRAARRLRLCRFAGCLRAAARCCARRSCGRCCKRQIARVALHVAHVRCALARLNVALFGCVGQVDVDRRELAAAHGQRQQHNLDGADVDKTLLLQLQARLLHLLDAAAR